MFKVKMYIIPSYPDVDTYYMSDPCNPLPMINPLVAATAKAGMLDENGGNYVDGPVIQKWQAAKAAAARSTA